ncbi:hypothetical protein ACFQ1M_12855 [Sungkyunkwania multivorans]|uniref:DUF5648 domain-containing protein n=1 Tax=Sungkyunkwania multivorans TaxID=1173618 RepID=A0ABW3D0W1_9FLAO
MNNIRSLGILYSSILVTCIFSSSCEAPEQDNPQEVSKSDKLLSIEEANKILLYSETPEAIAATEERAKELGFVAGAAETSRVPMRIENIRRHYAGGSLSVHTYKAESGSGILIGNSEGIGFRTPVQSGSGTSFDSSQLRFMEFFIHPQRKDFIMAADILEAINLKNRGWISTNVRGRNPIIHIRSGNGRKRLYRFYNAANTDHLFTKNYYEGLNAGYRFEGVVGWVY